MVSFSFRGGTGLLQSGCDGNDSYVFRILDVVIAILDWFASSLVQCYPRTGVSLFHHLSYLDSVEAFDTWAL